METAIIFGLGGYCRQYYSLISRKYDIVAVSDNDPEKWDKVFWGVKCIPPQDIFSFHVDTIILAVLWKREAIYNQLSEQCKENHIKLVAAEECRPKDVHEDIISNKYEWKDEYDNEITIGNGCMLHHVHFSFNGSGNKIIIGENVFVREGICICFGGDSNLLSIGSNTTIGQLQSNITENGRVQIGTDCMISSGIELLQDPSHPIYDVNTGKRINISKPITVGNHVWIGKNVTLLSGFEIGHDSVIGYGTISAGKFREHVTIVGNPAKIIHENIHWERDCVGYYPLQQMK